MRVSSSRVEKSKILSITSYYICLVTTEGLIILIVLGVLIVLIVLIVL